MDKRWWGWQKECVPVRNLEESKWIDTFSTPALLWHNLVWHYTFHLNHIAGLDVNKQTWPLFARSCFSAGLQRQALIYDFSLDVVQYAFSHTHLDFEFMHLLGYSECLFVSVLKSHPISVTWLSPSFGSNHKDVLFSCSCLNTVVADSCFQTALYLWRHKKTSVKLLWLSIFVKYCLLTFSSICLANRFKYCKYITNIYIELKL